MSYVDAHHDRETDIIRVVERVNGERKFVEYSPNYVFYYADPRGDYKSIYGDSVRKFSSASKKAFVREKMMLKNRKIFESDINPVFRCLEDNYLGVEAPSLNVCFFDIEVSMQVRAFADDHMVKVRPKEKKALGEKEINVYALSLLANNDEYEVWDGPLGMWAPIRESSYLKPGRGFAPIDDTFNNVTAITIYMTQIGKLVTLCMPPPSMTFSEAEAITSQFENTFLFEDEGDMLNMFLDLIDDADILSGWNSTGFDIPYMVNRITKVLGKDENRRWNLWNQLPKKREYFKFKKKSVTYDLIGRVHLDYLELYQKHNPQQLHSYRLDFVGEIETGENKIPYEGTLDDLYKKDFKKFIEYNRQDVLLLVKIDNKKKFIELANQIAHTNTVLLKTTMGSVALIEQAITNYSHSLGMVVPDRKAKDFTGGNTETDDEGGEIEIEEEATSAVGAYVAKPKVGINKLIGCVDINSLYPSVLRSLNISPETLVGHIRPAMTDALISSRIAAGVDKPDLWEGVFCTVEFEEMHKRSNEAIEIDFEDGTTSTLRASELNDYVFHQGRNLSISANGTVFRTDIPGIIPGVLELWYSQRRTMQAREKVWGDLGGGIDLGGLDLS